VAFRPPVTRGLAFPFLNIKRVLLDTLMLRVVQRESNKSGIDLNAVQMTAIERNVKHFACHGLYNSSYRNDNVNLKRGNRKDEK